MPLQATPSLRFSIQFISFAAQSGSSAKPIATVLFHGHSPPFGAIPSPFQNKTLLFQTFPPSLQSKLFRNVSFRLYVFPTQFIVFPNYSFAPIYAVPLSIIAILFPCLSALYDSFAVLDISYPFRCLNFSFPGLHFSVLHHSTTLKTSRLSRSCCSQASDSLEVYSSHQGNLCIRY